MNELLLLDAGNSSVSLAMAGSGGRMRIRRESTSRLVGAPGALEHEIVETWIVSCLNEFGVDPEAPRAWAVVSVVPAVDALLVRAAKSLGAELLFTPGDIPLDMENRYEDPGELGADRLLAAWAALRLFPAPGHLIVDFGTATTFECQAGGVYLGGLICPGLESSAKALASGTALLPMADVAAVGPEIAIGTSTAMCLAQGFAHGFAAMVTGLTTMLKEKLPEGSPVLATGGHARLMAGLVPMIDEVRPHLLLEGLRAAYLESEHGRP